MSGNTANPSPQAGSNSYPQNSGYRGQAWFNTPGQLLNAINFIVRNINAGQAHASLVKVISVSSGGGANGPQMIAVQPMVDQVDGFGNRTAHGQIYNIPCFRYQAGVCGVILDPVANDIGLAIFADRDISQVKSTGQISGPGSARQNSWADGLYFGSFLGQAVTTSIALTQDGKVTITAPGGLIVNANITVTGSITATQGIQAGTGGADSVTLQHHTHGGGPVPTPGT
jgi:hypothetical protein